MASARIIFLGAPGTGKGTQARRIGDRFGLEPLSSGDVMRAEIAAGSEVGKQAAQYVESGTLVPDEVITNVILASMEKLGSDAGVILDGFPRTVPQAEALEAGLARCDRRLDAVIDFQMSDDLIIERIAQRRVCSVCKKTYNTRFVPPKVDGTCDDCGGALEQRVDDRADVLATRLETYRVQTAPLIDYYESRGLLHTVDASADAASVEARVAGVIEGLVSDG